VLTGSKNPVVAGWFLPAVGFGERLIPSRYDEMRLPHWIEMRSPPDLAPKGRNLPAQAFNPRSRHRFGIRPEGGESAPSHRLNLEKRISVRLPQPVMRPLQGRNLAVASPPGLKPWAGRCRPLGAVFRGSPSRTRGRFLVESLHSNSAFPWRSFATIASLCAREYNFAQTREGRKRFGIWPPTISGIKEKTNL